ncbi:IclR family transcriptional regulator [Pseudonocardia spinosispora]|uniref:IclR family transcriptional regulator n=1 Tax=Pseudonocardia spinosispora TaxID=103441 RepID=UPI00048C9431|nr:IclR family transcriptional regulator [Pseudonocardia spinosispora]
MSQAVERAISILEMISKGPQRPQDVAERLQVHRTTALRLMQDLAKGGLARKNEDGTFTAGYRLAGLAHAALEQFDLRTIAHPHLRDLCRELQVTVHIATVVDDAVVYADKIEPHGKVRLYSEIGKPVRLHASGVGKAILAFMPPAERAVLLDGYVFERYTETTVASPDAFVEELRRIRARGFSTDDGEFESFVNCIGHPVYDATGVVRTAISVTAIKADTDLEALRARLPAIRRTATAISSELGWTT